ASLSAHDRGLIRSALLSRAERIAASLRGEDPSKIAPVSPEQAFAAPWNTIANALRHMSAYDGAAATAERFTRALKASGQAARYADRPNQTGSIPTQRVKVRSSRQSVQPIAGPPRPSACTLV